MGKAERTRIFILEKTAPLFNRKGFAGTSLSDLTESTGLTKGAIYGNFENKDDVALAAFDYNMAIITRQVKLLQSTEPTIAGKLKAYLKVYEQGLAKGILSDGCPIVNTGIEADDTHLQLKRKTGDMLSKWHKGISTLISQGIGKGEIKHDIDVAGFASLMIAMIEGGVTVSKISGDMSYINQSLKHLEYLIDTKLKR